MDDARCGQVCSVCLTRDPRGHPGEPTLYSSFNARALGLDLAVEETIDLASAVGFDGVDLMVRDIVGRALHKLHQPTQVVTGLLTAANFRILVADDEPDNVALLDAIRERHGNDPYQWLPVLLREVQHRKSRVSRSKA